MEKPLHPLRDLFKQLGLDSSSTAIDDFLARHAPLADHVELEKASFWTPPQAQFLSESVRDDADWAAVVDQLDAMLRSQPDS